MEENIVRTLHGKLTEDIERLYPGLLANFPIDEYIHPLVRTRKNLPYKKISPRISAICRRIATTFGMKALGAYHKGILLSLISNDKIIKHKLQLPTGIQDNYNKFVQKIIDRIIAEGPDKNCDYYQYSNDKFIKDIGICRISLIPAGPVLLDTGWMPLLYLLKKGVMPFLKGLIMVIRYRSLVPVLKMHTYITNSIVMSNFNETGWIKFYENIADMMLLDTRYRGVYCAGWFFDPAMKEVSPEISYIHQLVSKLGGDSFCIGTDDGVVKDSTFMNSNRKKMVQDGNYTPTRYVIFIPRKKLIMWRKEKGMKP